MAAPEAKKAKIEGRDVDMEGDMVPSTSNATRTVQELMPQYYARLFPHKLFYRWLVYGNDGKHPQADGSFFQRREFCFTMEDDIFIRYQSFKDGQSMAEAITRKCPAKIDIGPVYTYNPQDRKKYEGTGEFYPVERELVFDIDLTDYDDVRTCGKEGHICTHCWPLMAVAIKIIDRGLREDFGFDNILWVYSGRRGVHCWVCDPSARRLTDEQRSAIVNYFAVYKGHEADRVKLALGASSTALHPAVAQAARELRDIWPVLLESQELLTDPVMQANVLKMIPDETTQQAVLEAWKKPVRSRELNQGRWAQLLDVLERRKQEVGKGNKLRFQLQRCESEIIFAHTYPRLDMEVSKKMNHLLKAPFCVHPKTGKVCVPIDPDQAFEFNPDTVPTVHGLLAQLPAKPANKGVEEWEATSMADSMHVFETSFLEGCVRSNREQLVHKTRTAVSAPSLAF